MFRFREYTVCRDEEPDAEPVAHVMQCAVCGVTGPEAGELGEATRWALRHVREQPEHFTYRRLVRLPYRVVPGSWR
ncbi:hypothetical protein [Streptomyces sp. JJ66]|uniref:DUF7848 domain-containing protein n=1 Tax=Streptomyces sp. JJ66 TaxID=2803843 RepID=UPI00214A9BE5|nr:hypothetical protein [Streptomyces sp. JJ66]